MRQQLYRHAQKYIASRRLSRWRDLALPGLLTIGLVCLIRLSGLLQTQEWMALDTFSSYCQLRPPSEQITLVTIAAADYQSLDEFPISNATLAAALSALQQYEPRAIGLDIFKELPDTADQDKLHQLMLSMPNVVAVEVALSPTMNIPAPAGMPPEQVGFADIVTDADGKMRRMVLATENVAGNAAGNTAGNTANIKYSLAVQLVRLYLQRENIPLVPGTTASDPIQFGTVVLPQFHPNAGGYIRASVSGNQTLMNFCMLQRSYETLSLRDLLAGNVRDQQLRDRIVIVGNIAPSAKETFITGAVRDTLHSTRVGGRPVTTKIIYGLEVHAHAAKQLLSSAIAQPCVLTTWPDAVEYMWIISWGLLGIGLSVWLMSP